MSKLIKYDFLYTNKSLLVIYVLSIVSTIVVLISGSFNTDIGIATEAISKDFALICLLITLIVPFFKCFFKIKNSLYKNEAYLTHTLPIEKGVLYDAKLFSAIFTLIISWVIFGVCFMSAFSGMNFIKLLLNVVNDSSMLSTSIEIVSLIISELLFIFICSVISLIIGNMFDENRDFKTFIFMLIIYLSLRLIVLSVIEIFNLNYYAYTTILFLILSIILYFIGRKLFKKGINLEY